MLLRSLVCLSLLSDVLSAGPALAQSPAPPANRTDGPGERRIYVPYEELGTLLERDGQGVLLRRTDYEKLKGRAARASTGRTRTIVVSAAESSGAIVDDQLVFTTTVTFHQARDSLQSLELPFRNVAVESAALDDQPAELARSSDDRRALVLFSDRAGRHQLRLTLSTPLVRTGSDLVASLGLPPIPSATFALELPAGKYLQAGDAALERREPPDQPARYSLAVGGQRELVLRITDRRVENTASSLVFAATAIGQHVAPEEQTWRAVTALNVFGKPIDGAAFKVPAALQIISVESIGLDRWELVKEQEETLVRLTYRQPFTGSRTIVFHGITNSVLGQPWSVSRLQILDAAAHQVGILVQTQPSLRLQANEATAVRRIAASEAAAAGLPATPDMSVRVAATQQLHYAAWRDDFTLSFTTQPRARELWSSITTRVDVGSADLRLESAIHVQTQHGSLFDFDLSLPAEWTVDDLWLGDQSADWRLVPVEAGRNVIRVMFQPGIPPGGAVDLRLRAFNVPSENWPPESNPAELVLPEVQLTESTVTSGRYLVSGGADLELTPHDLEGLDAAKLTPEEQAASANQLAWEYQDTRYKGQLKIARRPARLLVQTVAYHRLGRDTLSSHLEAQIQVGGGGVRLLQIALPEQAGTDLRFRILPARGRQAQPEPEITEQSAMPPEGEQRVWTLRLSRRVLGAMRLAVGLQRPRGEVAEDVVITLPGLRVLGAERQTGQIAVEGGADQQLTVGAFDDNGQMLREIEAADLSPAAGYRPGERVVAAYESARPGERLTVRETRYQPGSVPTAICDRLRMESVLGETGELQHQADFTVRAVGVQGLLIQPSGEAELWATLVDDQPLEVRVDQSRPDTSPTYLIPLPPVDPPDRVRRVRVLYRTQRAQAGGVRSLYESPPKLAVLTGAGDRVPLDILQQDWRLYHPKSLNVIRSRGEFRPVTPLTRQSLLGQWQHWLSRQSWMERAWRAGLLVALGSFLGLAAVVVRRRGTGRIAGALALCTLLVIVAYSLVVPQIKTASLPSAEYYAEAAKTSELSPTVQQPTFEMAPAAGEGKVLRKAQFDEFPTSGTMAGRLPNPVKSDGIPEGRAGMTPLPAPPQIQAPQNATGPLRRQDPAQLDAVPDNRPQVAQNAGPGMMGGGGLPAPAGGPQPPARPQQSTGKRGRLSLSIALQVPSESVATDLRFAGVPTGSEEPALQLEVADEHGASTTSFAWQAGMLLLFWLLRKADWRLRTVVGVAGVLVPWALFPLMRLDLLPVLDGLFLGASWGWLLWTVCAVFKRLRFHSVEAALNGTSLGLWLCGALCAGQIAEAQEPVRENLLNPEGSNVVILPYDPAGRPEAAEHVFVPWKHYLELTEAAGNVAVQGAATVSEVVYSVQLIPADARRSATARVQARVGVLARAPGQSVVPLPFRNVTLSAASLNGAPAPLVGGESAAENEPLAVVIDTPGLHRLEIEFSLPVEANGPAGTLTLPLTAAATGTVQFELPANELSLRVSGGARGFRRVVRDNVPIALLALNQPGPVTISWGPRFTREGADAVVNAETTAAWILTDVGLRYTAHTAYAIRQGGMTEAVFTIPDGWLTRQISGPDVAGWEIAPEGDQQQLTVRLRRTVTDGTVVVVELFRAEAVGEESTAVSVPAFAPVGTMRETGIIGVFVAEQFSISSGAASGISQVEGGQFPDSATDLGRAVADGQGMRPQRVYRHASRPFDLQFLVARQKPVSRGTAEHAVSIGSRKLSLSSRFELQLAGAPRSEISLQLPEGFLLYDVKCPRAIDNWVTGNEDGAAGVLHVELEAPITGELEVVVDGIVPRLPDDPVAIVVAPLPLEIGDLRSTIGLWIDPAFAGRVEDSTGWRPADPAALPPALRGYRAEPARFAYATALTGIQPLALILDPAPVRLSADSLAQILIQDAAVEYALFLRWNIASAASSRFYFTTPEWLAGRLEIAAAQRGVRIRQVTSESAGEGRQRWMVELEEPCSQSLILSGTASLPLPDTGRVAAPLVVFEQVVEFETGRQFRVVDPHRGYLLLVNQGWQRASGEGLDALEPVQPDDLPIRLPDLLRRQTTGLWRIRDFRADPGWQLDAATLVRGVGAAVNYAELTQVIAHDGGWRLAAEYQVVNRSRQFLPVRIPPASKILSVFVDGRPARPIDPHRPGIPDVVLIPLPRTAPGDLSSRIKVTLQGRLPVAMPHGVQVRRTVLDLPVPQILTAEEDPQHGMPVAATEWNVYLSDRLDAVRIDDPDRTNVAETVSGLDRSIATMQEWLDLYRIANDVTTSDSARVRSLSNLKQLGQTLQSSPNSVSQFRDGSVTWNSRVSEQQRELQELRSQIDTAARELDSDKFAGNAKGRVIRGFAAQQQVVEANTMTVPADEFGRQSQQGLQLQKQTAKVASGKAAGVAADQSGPRRSKMNEYNRRQSGELSGAIEDLAKSSQPVDGKPKSGVTVLNKIPRVSRSGNKTIRGGEAAGELPQPAEGEADPLGAGFAMDGEPNAAASAAPSGSSGLSLEIEIPREAQRLTFTNSGGRPRLALGVRPTESLDALWGLFWAAVWLAAGAVVLMILFRTATRGGLWSLVPMLASIGGGLWFLFLPEAVVGLGLFVLGAGVLAARTALRAQNEP